MIDGFSICNILCSIGQVLPYTIVRRGSEYPQGHSDYSYLIYVDIYVLDPSVPGDMCCPYRDTRISST